MRRWRVWPRRGVWLQDSAVRPVDRCSAEAEAVRCGVQLGVMSRHRGGALSPHASKVRVWRPVAWVVSMRRPAGTADSIAAS